MKLYKLTDKNGQTYNDTQWGEGVCHTAPGKGELCTGGWIHAYTDPLLAVLLNPVHASFKDPQLWEAEGDVGIEDHGLKVGCNALTTIRQLPVPEVGLIQRVAFGILCALHSKHTTYAFAKWAEDWLDGKDRTATAAAAAAAAAGAAYAAAVAAAVAADYAAYAAYAAATAAAAAAANAYAQPPLDLPALARQAMEVK